MAASRAYLAEFLGTFLFLSIGYASIGAIDASGATGLLVVPFSFGLGLLAAIFAVGHLSGGHFNPAVTVAMVLDKRTTPVEAIGYIVAQIAGAIAAAGVVMATVSQATVAAGVTKPGGGVTDIGALILEILFTAGFLLVILTVTRRASSLAPLAIPFTLVAIHFAIAPLSGSSLNPARSLGSAIVGADLSVIWIYLVGPVVGAILAWIVFKATDLREEGPEEAPASAV